MTCFIVLPLLALKKSLVGKKTPPVSRTSPIPVLTNTQKLDIENAPIFWIKMPKIQRNRILCFSKEEEGQYHEQSAT